MSHTIDVDALADEVMRGLEEYADLAADEMKKAVRATGTSVRKDISENAPKDTGAYAKSWSVKSTTETASTLEMVVYSRNRYRLAHLLEYGHAKRGGGRVAAKPHIAPAEQRGAEKLEREIRKALEG